MLLQRQCLHVFMFRNYVEDNRRITFFEWSNISKVNRNSTCLFKSQCHFAMNSIPWIHCIGYPDAFLSIVYQLPTL